MNKNLIKIGKQKGKNIRHIRHLSLHSFEGDKLSLEVNSLSSKRFEIEDTYKILIEEKIEKLMKQVRLIIQQNNLSYENTLNYLRSSIIFKEIDDINSKLLTNIINDHYKNKIRELQECLNVRDKQIKQLKFQINQTKQFSERKSSVNVIENDSMQPLFRNTKIISSKNYSLGEIVFKKARILNMKQFSSYFSNNFNAKPLQIKNIKEAPIQIKLSKSFIKQNQEMPKIQKLEIVVKQLIYSLTNFTVEDKEKLLLQFCSQLGKKCSQPCCRMEEAVVDKRVNKAKNFLSDGQQKSRKSKIVYKSKKFDEYFQRYYQKPDFQITNITSAIKTHSSEMQMLEKQYEHNRKSAQKQKQRSNSIIS